MPIAEMTYLDGIFFSRQYGKIAKEDARTWADQAQRLAKYGRSPIVAFLDLRDVTQITREARAIYTRISALPRLWATVILAEDLAAVQQARLIAQMDVGQNTHIFQDKGRAYAFARAQAEAARRDTL